MGPKDLSLHGERWIEGDRRRERNREKYPTSLKSDEGETVSQVSHVSPLWLWPTAPLCWRGLSSLQAFSGPDRMAFGKFHHYFIIIPFSDL